MSNDTVTRFFGGSPVRIAIQLVVLSFFLGLVLNALGVSPYDIVNGLRDLFRRIYDMGFDTIGIVVRYILLGAVIVVPIWLVLRLTRVGRRSS
ncbi:MAG: integrase [Rhizobiales bacterium]|nr:integrase [Hyphomicrobiales bacterium]